ncbi:MAG: Crp/Fnr family transcriptional regulator [Bacteroidota bacterium]
MPVCDQAPIASTTCSTCTCVPADIWDGMSAEFMEGLARRKAVRTLKRGSYLFHQGYECEAVFRLLSGVLLLRKGDHEGHSLVVRMVRPGATLGYRALVRNEVHSVSAHCATDVVVCQIPARAARWAFDNNRALEREFASNMVRDIDRSENQALNMLTLCVRDRVLVLVHQLAEYFGRHDGDALRIEAPLSKSDMAAMLGIARESMSRCIRLIEEQQILEFSGDGITAPSFALFQSTVAAILGQGEAGDSARML